MNKKRICIVSFRALLAGVLFLLALVAGAAPAAANPGVKYVKPTAIGTGDCSSWANACALQTALSTAVYGDEIWVAAGTHTPNTTFAMRSGVAIYGGFPAAGGDWSTRNPATNTTTLRGWWGGYYGDHVVSADSTVTQTARLDGFTITGGYITAGYAQGGGMYIVSGSPTVANVIFSGNYARNDGGGMYVGGGSPALMNVTFSNNSAIGGGGMYVAGGAPTLTNVAFNSNSVTYEYGGGYGGGLYVSQASPSLTNVTFSGNSASTGDSRSAAHGAGMYVYQGNPSLTTVTFSDNSVSGGYGGGLSVGYGSPSLTNVTFSGNSASSTDLGTAGYGGGMYVSGGSPPLTNVTFSGNSAINGGGMSTYAATPTLSGITFSGNSATNGGGMYASGGGSGSVITFTTNTATNGGGLYVAGDLALSDTTFAGNTATEDGGGLYVVSGNPALSRVDLVRNSAGTGLGSGRGGGLYVAGGGPRLVGGAFKGNTSGHEGAGAYVAGGTPQLVNAIFSGNKTYYEGSGIAIFGGTTTLANATFASNYSFGIHWWDGSATLTNGILWGNLEGQILGSGVTVSYSDVQGGRAGTGNINADPLFVRNPSWGADHAWGTADDDYGDLHLQYGSPAIDAGNNAAPGLGGVIADFDGNPRFRDDPRVPDTGSGTPPIVDMGPYEWPGPTIYYVKESGSSANTCASWGDACDLQSAIARAASGNEVWVAAGTYTPTTGSSRVATFTLKNGVGIYGGFAGSETYRAGRNWSANASILSGDIGTLGLSADNSCHVVVGDGTDASAVLDGFTIREGKAEPACGSGSGGGMSVASGSPTLANLTLAENQATGSGGGLFITGSSPALTNVSFISNTAGAGGGMDMAGGSPTLTNVTFRANQATTYHGGGMYVSSGGPTLKNVVFAGNAAHTYAGGLFLQSNASLTNVSFGANTAPTGGGLVLYGLASATVSNGVLWGNSGSQIWGNTGGASISYSIVQGWANSDVNHVYGDRDPLFVNAASGDLHLQDSSPAINSGSNALAEGISTDRDGNPRVVGGIVDLGAYEYPTATAPTNLIATGGASPSTIPAGGTILLSVPVTPGQYPASLGITATADLSAIGGSAAQELYDDGTHGDAVAGNNTFSFRAAVAYTTTAGAKSLPIAVGDVQGRTASTSINVNVTTGMIYVNKAAPPGGDGTSWATALPELRDALALADTTGGATYEIWVTAGSYTSAAGLDRSAAFTLQNGVAIYGGFAGTETSRAQRNWLANATTLSGNIGEAGLSSDNSCHVVVAGGAATTAVLDGFTIRDGNASGCAAGNGGGMFVDASSPTLANLAFTGNYASGSGGGLYVGTGNPTMTNVTFSGNSAGSGGGMYSGGSPTLARVAFRGNSAANGGGLYSAGGNPLLSNVLLSGNAAGSGGGMYVSGGSPALTNVTLGGNAATTGGGIYVAAGAPAIVNGILWDNGGGEIAGSASVSYSIVMSATNSEANHVWGDRDPLFASPVPANSAPTTTGDLRLLPHSAAIDAGNNAAPGLSGMTTDLDGNPRFHDDLGTPPNGTPAPVDLGAYEFQGVSPLTGSGIIYVRQSATGANTGASWQDAFTSLQSALAVASPGATDSIQIWVATGLYSPGGWLDTFALKNRVAVYGGFPAGGGDWSSRDWTANVTTLGTNASSWGSGGPCHIVTASAATDSSAILDGFRINGGYASCGGGSDLPQITIDFSGGGLQAFGSPTLSNLVFSNNYASYLGAGMYLADGSPSLTNVTFRNNRAQFAGGGVAIHNASPTMVDITFLSNSRYFVNMVGGAMWVEGGSTSLTGAIFNGNTGGGGLYLTSVDYYDQQNPHVGSVALSNVVFADNTGSDYGAYPGAGGMSVIAGTATLTNVVFSGNQSSTTPGGLYVGAEGSVAVVNSILWGNRGPGGGFSQLAVVSGGSLDVSYSDVQGGCVGSGVTCGSGNIAVFPFINSGDLNVAEDIDWDGPDGIVGTLDDGIRLRPGSPAIDAGSNAALPPGLTTDLAGAPRVRDGDGDGVATVDMGVFEVQWPPVTSGIIYVDHAATGSNDGSSWANAFTDLQSALALANPVTETVEIWVAAGSYKPTIGTDRVGTFQLKNGVAIYGGFAGTESALEQRDWAAHPVTLSGEIGAPGSGDNSYHVVSAYSWITESAVLDGFTITGGKANDSGGGILADGVPTLAHLTVTGNEAYLFGGGMYVKGSLRLTDIAFTGNSASYGGGLHVWSGSPTLANVTFDGNQSGVYGGGMAVGDPWFDTPYTGVLTLANVAFNGNTSGEAGGLGVIWGGTITLTDVTFSGNSAPTVSGGGMAAGMGGMYPESQGNLTLNRVSFRGNSSDSFGGGMSITGWSPRLTNVVFSGNAASNGYGGGLYAEGAPVLTNVTFAGNRASSGGALAGQSYGGTPTIVNSILWGDGGGEINWYYGISIADSIVQGHADDDANHVYGSASYDPLFVAPVDAGSAPTAVGDLRLQAGSPAIDAGDDAAIAGVATDLDGNPRVAGAHVDLGAYERQVGAPILGLVATNDSPTVLGSATTLTATVSSGGAITYTWAFGDETPLGAGAVVTHTYQAVGSYTATVTATNAISTAVATTPVTITASPPIADAGPDQTVFVSPTVVTLDGSGSYDPGGFLPLSFAWTQTGGTPVILSGDTISRPTFVAPDLPAVLTFTLAVTNSQGIASAVPDSVVVTVTEAPIVGLAATNDGPTPLGSPTIFTATVESGSNVAYTWYLGPDPVILTGAVVTHTYTEAGTFTATVMATNSISTVVATTPVTITNLAPVADAGADQTVFVGEEVTLDGSGSYDPGGFLPLSFAWTQTGGTPVILSGDTISRPTFVAPDLPAVLTFTLAVTDAAGLTGSTPDTVVVTVTDTPILGLAAFNDGPTVIGGQTSFTATLASGSNVTYAWDFGDGGVGASGSTVTHDYALTGSYTATVTATNTISTVVATTLVTITDAGIVGLVVTNDSPTPLGLPTAFMATIDSGSGVTYQWAFGDGTFEIGAASEVTHTYDLAGRYTASVTATNSINTVVATTPVTISNPVPAISSISPMLATAGSPDVTLSISGSSFVADSVARWYDAGRGSAATLTTTFGSSTQLTAVVPAAFLTTKTAEITVFNPAPGGGVSNLVPFYVTLAGTEILDWDADSGGAGGSSVFAGGVITATGGPSGTLVVAQFSSNPAGPLSLSAGAVYFDLYAASDNAFAQVEILVCGLPEYSRPRWWDGSAWLLVEPSSAWVYDEGTGCLTITLTDGSSPSVAQLHGTFFALGADALPGGTFWYPETAIDEGSVFTIAVTTDPEWQSPGGTLYYRFDCGDGSGPVTGVLTSTTCTALDNPSQAVTGTLILAGGGSREYTATIEIDNVAPTVAILGAPATSAEGTEIVLTSVITEPGPLDLLAGFDYNWRVMRNGSPYGSPGSASTYSFTPDASGAYSVTLGARDKDGGLGLDTKLIAVTAVAPTVGISGTTSVQYSDRVAYAITATIPGADLPLTPTVQLGPTVWFTPTLAAGGCTGSGTVTCTWEVGGPVAAPAGSYTITASVVDVDGDVGGAGLNVLVRREDAEVEFDAGNPLAVKVATAGGTGTFALRVSVFEDLPDLASDLAAAGDINLAQVSVLLLPVGPGANVVPTRCDRSISRAGVGYSYRDRLNLTCTFSNVPVNTYAVQVTVSGSYYYYLGSDEDVLTVYDPSLGFTSGGGWFDWDGDRTNFGFTMKYNKGKNSSNVQGSLLLIRHTEDGLYKVKSNALGGLSLGQFLTTTTGTAQYVGWASFGGKATYAEPGADAIGNYTFLAYVEDWNEPGKGIDRFWIELKNPGGSVVLTLGSPAQAEAEPIRGGNIVVPHQAYNGSGGAGGGGKKGQASASAEEASIEPTPDLTATVTTRVTATSTSVPTPTPTLPVTPSATPTATATPTPPATTSPSATATPLATATATPTATATATPLATSTPPVTPSPTATPTSGAAKKGKPATQATPTATPTATQPSPSAAETAPLAPSPTPSPTASQTPTPAPTPTLVSMADSFLARPPGEGSEGIVLPG